MNLFEQTENNIQTEIEHLHLMLNFYLRDCLRNLVKYYCLKQLAVPN